MTSISTYEIVNGELIIRSKETGEIMWRGKPKGYEVAVVLPIEQSDDYIVLLEWLKSGLENQKNLLRLEPSGNIVWEVGDPPKDSYSGPERGQESESYTQIMVENPQLIASSYSGYADFIDVETGYIYKSEFVK